MNININKYRLKYTFWLFLLLCIFFSQININIASHSKKHDFFIAAFDGDLKKVKQLLADGIDVNAKLRGTMTALITAAGHKQYEVTKYLIKEGADVNLSDEDYWTPLFHAANTGDKQIVELLLKHGAKAEIKDNKGQTPLSRVIKYDLMKLLIEHGANVNVVGSSGTTPLIKAARNADINFIRYLLEKGANVNAVEKGATYHNYNPRRTAIGEAVDQHRVDVVKLLLDYGADPHIPNDDGTTSVRLAKKRGYDDILKIFHDYNVMEPTKK